LKLWEYHICRNTNPEEFNKLGMQGWELVSVTSPGTGLEFVAFFKREVVSAGLLMEEANTQPKAMQ
jgi:hypothetical protein